LEFNIAVKIIIIDNGLGNITSVANAIKKLNYNFEVTNSKSKIKSSNVYILPGVGAFPKAMMNLKKNGLIDILKEQLIHKKKPYLGICLGMQLLSELSEEQGLTKGLNFVKGKVKKLKKTGSLNIPNVGWRKVKLEKKNFLFNKISQGSFFYFDHSYSLVNTDKKFILSTTNYGNKVVSCIKKNNLIGVQFHPEKSQINGLRLLKNFLQYAKKNF
tara:strand:- start:188 stop:832 length:645 start_codon:yes stop_codon:yes gene_type:complete